MKKLFSSKKRFNSLFATQGIDNLGLISELIEKIKIV